MADNLMLTIIALRDPIIPSVRCYCDVPRAFRGKYDSKRRQPLGQSQSESNLI